jgi:DMSO/TMAO reductase YedYZ molybdopterin-dependent catalytic subunit
MSIAMDDRLIGRAGFLGLLGAGVAGLFFARDVTGLLGRALPSGASFLPGQGSWRIYTIADRMPSIAPAAYRLRIDGEVGNPTTLTMADLRALPQAVQTSDFHCVTGWTVPNVRWRGVRFQDVLQAASPLPSAKYVRFVSAEQPYDDSLTLEQAFLPDVMLATEMDGQPLTRPHGGPARVVMPRMYGYKNVKWVTRIELGSEPKPGYWEIHGYDTDAWIGRSNGL